MTGSPGSSISAELLISQGTAGAQESRRCLTHAHHSAGAAKRRNRPESDCEMSPITAPRARLAVRSGRTCRPAWQAGPPNQRVRSWPSCESRCFFVGLSCFRVFVVAFSQVAWPALDLMFLSRCPITQAACLCKTPYPVFGRECSDDDHETDSCGDGCRRPVLGRPDSPGPPELIDSFVISGHRRSRRGAASSRGD